MRELYATYYRGIPGVMNFGSLTNENTDPKGNRMTITDVVAQLKRRTTDRVDGPLQLAIPVMVNKDGEESIIFPMPQVGGAIIPAAARVHGLTLDEAERQGIGYSVDYLGVNGFKNVPWFARPSAALIFGGDGTEPLGSSGQSMMKRTASVFVMLNNGMQIGARLKDVYAGELEDIGVSEGVPGIRAGKTEVDRAYLAVYFATRRAIMGGGSTNLNLETSLLVPHSISHGEYQVGVYFKKFERIISEQGVDGEFVDKLFRIGQSQSIEKVQEGVIELLREPYNIPQDLREALMIFVAEVVDPNDIIDEFIEQGYLTDEERSQWQTLAHEEFAAAVKEIDILPLASKEHTMLQPIRFPLRNKKKLIAPLPEGAPKILRAGMAEAMAHVIDKALSDPAHRLMVQGVDTNKGYKVERNRLTGQGEAIITGGYWEQTALSREPLRLESFESGQINEELLIQWAIGMSLNSMRRPEEGHQTVVDLQYVDYASKALGYLAYLLQQPNVTAAQMTLRFGLIATTGLSAGVSPGHGAEYTGFFNNLPDVMDFYYPSTAQDMYDLMMSALYGGLDHPFLLLWPRNNPFAKEDISLQLTLDSLPGKARMRVNQEPTDNLFQIISWGPMMIKVREELAKREKTDGVAMWKGLNHFDPRTLRPFDYEGLHQYLKLGAPTGAPIIIMEEGYPGKDFGTSLYAKIMMDPFFADVLNNGRRQIRVLGALPLDANPASVIMQQEVLPNVSHLFDLLKARDRTGLNALYNRHFQYAR